MQNEFHSAIAAGMEALNAVAGESVEYVRGGVSKTITAVYSPREYAAAVELNALLSYQSDDFLIVRADLDLGDGPTEPQRGDLIRRNDGERVEVYAVQNVPGQNCFRKSGPLRWRIHAKLMETT